MRPSPSFTGILIMLCPFLVLCELEELITWLVVHLQGFGCVCLCMAIFGFLYFGGVTFNKVFCNSIKALLLSLHSAICPHTLKKKKSTTFTTEFHYGAVLTFVSLWQYSALQSDAAVLKARYEERIQELEKDQDRSSPADFTEEVSLII